MKAALCLSGFFDSKTDLSSKGVDGFKHLEKHVFSKIDTDVYIHSWDVANKNQILDLYGDRVKSSIFQEPIDFSPIATLKEESGRTKQSTIFSHLYSVQSAFRLACWTCRMEDYDWVIKSRFDIGRINRNSSGPGRQNPYAVQCINFNPNLPNKALYLADWQYFDTEGPADMWFYGSEEVMLQFAYIFDQIKNDMVKGGKMEDWAGPNDGGLVNPIKCYKWFLLKTGLWQIKKPLPTFWE